MPAGETRTNVSGWTVDTLSVFLQQQIVDLRGQLEERYTTQTNAVNAAFEAQQRAMETAFKAADTAVQAALQSAEKAVNKAEAAAEKRFEGVNEFRDQLRDQAALFATRTEVGVRIDAISEKVDHAESRLDKSQGQSNGLDNAWGYLIAAAGVALAIYANVKG